MRSACISVPIVCGRPRSNISTVFPAIRFSCSPAGVSESMGSDQNMPAPGDEVRSGLSTFNRRLDAIFEILANLEQRGRSDRSASERDDQVINARLQTLIDDLEVRWRRENEAQTLTSD